MTPAFWSLLQGMNCHGNMVENSLTICRLAHRKWHHDQWLVHEESGFVYGGRKFVSLGQVF